MHVGIVLEKKVDVVEEGLRESLLFDFGDVTNP
jgi:hypothetical protein